MSLRFALLTCALAATALASGCTPSETEDPRVEAILDLEPDPDEGLVIFDANCTASGCHGPTGDDGVAPALSDRVPLLSDEQLTLLLLDGTDRMPAQVQLDDQEKADVLAFIIEIYD